MKDLEVFEKYLTRGASTCSLDELNIVSLLKNKLLQNQSNQSESELLANAHRLASHVGSARSLFDVCVSVSALNLIVASALTENRALSSRCVSAAHSVTGIRG